MTADIETLEAQLAAAAGARDRIDILNTLSRELRDIDPQRALACAQEAYELSGSGEFAAQPYLAGRALSLCRLAESNMHLGAYDRALEQAFAAVELAGESGSGEVQAQALRVIGMLYGHLGDYPEALSYALEALKQSQAAGDRHGEALTQNLLGILYNKLGDYHQELAAYEQAIELFREAGQQRLVAALLNNIATAYTWLRQADRALEYGRQSLQIARELGLSMLEATVLGTIGEAYLLRADYPQARTHFEQAVDMARQMGFRYIEMYGLLSLGKVHAAQQQPEEAIPLLQQAQALAEEIRTKPELFECHRLLADLHKGRGEFAAALEHYERYHAIKEAVFNEEADRRIKNLQVLHRTETARQEAEIYRLRNVELEEEMARREGAEESLRQYAVELERQNAELDAFAHTVAHDLKNSLGTLSLYTDIPMDVFVQMPAEEQYSFLQGVAGCGRRMNSIIDALLLLSSVRGKEVELERLDMGTLVAAALDRLTYLISESRARVTMPERWPTVLCYGPWIEEVWVNYVTNAIKYGGRPPHVELGATVRDDGWVRCWVRDNGPGLPAADQSRLFTPFERLHQVRAGGHGLGLSIVRRIVETLGGRVGVDSNPAPPWQEPVGSTFYFDLPAAET